MTVGKTAQKDLNKQLRQRGYGTRNRQSRICSNLTLRNCGTRFGTWLTWSPKGSPLVANNGIARTNERNYFYLWFETDTFKEFGEVLDKEACEDRMLIDPCSLPKFLKHYKLTKQKDLITFFNFSFKDICGRTNTSLASCFPAFYRHTHSARALEKNPS